MKKSSHKYRALFFVFFALQCSAQSKLPPCGVCIGVVDEIKGIAYDRMKASPKLDKEDLSKEAIDNFCSQQDHLQTGERKMCYYLEPLRQMAARGVAVKMTTARMCKKLSKENPDICSLFTVVEQNP